MAAAPGVLSRGQDRQLHQGREATFRTQSALSQQVRALEEELDCQLLERLGKRRLRLTPAGDKLLEFSQAVLARFETLKKSSTD